MVLTHSSSLLFLLEAITNFCLCFWHYFVNTERFQLLCFQNFEADIFETVFLVSCSSPEGWHSTASIRSPTVPVFSYVNDNNASSTSKLLLRAIVKHMILVIFVHGDSHRLTEYRRCKGISWNTILISQLPVILSDFYSSVWWTQFFLLLGGIVSNFWLFLARRSMGSNESVHANEEEKAVHSKRWC